VLIKIASRMMRSSMGKIHYEFIQAPPVEMVGAYGIYLNVPFCYTRCNYCPFYSEPFAKHADKMGEYLEAVRQEIQQARLRGKVQWTYVGGGTPNTLSVAQLGKLLDEIRKQVDPGLLGIELLPARVDEAYLRGLRSLGFSRISMGVPNRLCILFSVNCGVIPAIYRKCETLSANPRRRDHPQN